MPLYSIRWTLLALGIGIGRLYRRRIRGNFPRAWLANSAGFSAYLGWRKDMKKILNSIALGGLAAIVATAQPQPQYQITDLGPAGSPFAQATGISNRGFISGFATAADGTSHAVSWYKGQVVDISQPGLGGPNSSAIGVNESGLILVQAESSTKDSENFCGYGTGLACLPALWRNGVVTPLPLLGGNNGSAGGVNNRGEAAGAAETSTQDLDCPKGVLANGTGPLKFDFA